MPWELVVDLGQPFDVLIGDRWVTLPPDGEIRVQFADAQAAGMAWQHAMQHLHTRPCRDEADGYTAKVVKGEVVEDDPPARRAELVPPDAQEGKEAARTSP